MNCRVEEFGLMIHPKYSFLGASPDAIVSCSKCGTGIVEVKCPYGKKENLYRKLDPVACAKVPGFCCHVINDKVTLKTGHDYHYQVMGLLGVTGHKWADFVVWTTKGTAVQRIHFDSVMWAEMLEKLKNFYTDAMIPELFTRRVKRGQSLYNE